PPATAVPALIESFSPVGQTGGQPPSGNTGYPLQNNAFPERIALNSSDLNLYFAERGFADGSATVPAGAPSAIGKITTAGTVTEYNLTGAEANAHPFGIIAVGTNLWFTEDAGDSIDSVAVPGATLGSITRYPIDATAPSPTDNAKGLTVDASGNLWVCAYGDNALAKLSTTAPTTPTKFSLGATTGPTNVIVGPDGNLWVTEALAFNVVEVNPATGTVVATYPVPNTTSTPKNWTDTPTPIDLTIGNDGNVWVTLLGGGEVARIVI
ncbi:MAG: hypothetical protein ACREM6_01945, partial [Vulcanimicrobiaceae bacterium]